MEMKPRLMHALKVGLHQIRSTPRHVTRLRTPVSEGNS